MGGVDERTGEPFILYDVVFAGYGGQAMKDGVEAMSPVMNCPNIPVEVHEAHNPVLIRKVEFIPDSAGPANTAAVAAFVKTSSFEPTLRRSICWATGTSSSPTA